MDKHKLSMLLLMPLILTLSGCVEVQRPPREYIKSYNNDIFLDSYAADLVPSTPSSATATFPDRSIFSEKDRLVLAKLSNIKATVNRTEDIPGWPAWEATLSGFITGNNFYMYYGCGTTVCDYDDIVSDDKKGIKFEVIFRNDAGGVIGKLTSGPVMLTCKESTVRLTPSKRFETDIITASTKANLDISIVDWVECK